MSPTSLIAVFGAAARADGSPSDALLRRIGCGLAAARIHPEAPVLCSGGAGPVRPSEASVMAQYLAAAGVAPHRLILDEASLSTRANVAAAAAAARAGGHERVVVCSDAYHMPRILLLMRLAGMTAEPGPQAPRPPLGHHLAMSLREAAAIAHNLALAAAHGRRRAPSPGPTEG